MLHCNSFAVLIGSYKRSTEIVKLSETFSFVPRAMVVFKRSSGVFQPAFMLFHCDSGCKVKHPSEIIGNHFTMTCGNLYTIRNPGFRGYQRINS